MNRPDSSGLGFIVSVLGYAVGLIGHNSLENMTVAFAGVGIMLCGIILVVISK